MRSCSYLEGGANHDPGDRDLVVCVFDAFRAASGSGVGEVPAFVRIHAAGCLTNPSRLTAAKRVERAALVKLWSLPTWDSPPPGLIAPVGRAAVLAAQALWQERVVLHLGEYRHMARFGRVAGRLGLRNGMRSGETFQFRWQLAGFGFARVNGEIRIGMRARPKDWKRQRLFLLDDVTFLAAADLVQLSLERLFPGASPPHLPRIVMPGLCKSVGPYGHAVFQLPGGPMTTNDLNRCYGLLMAGSPPSVLHGLRHVFANAAAMDGTELADISDLLSQEGYSLAHYYAAATERQVAAALARLHDRAEDRAVLA